MVTGRPPVPVAVREARGESPKPGVVTRLEPPTEPEGLTHEQQCVWFELVEALHALGILDKTDALPMETMVYAVDRMRRAQEIVNDEGILSENSQGVVRHPAVAVLEAAEKQVTNLSERLGLGPWGRTRLGLRQPDGQGGDISDIIGAPPRVTVVEGGR